MIANGVGVGAIVGPAGEGEASSGGRSISERPRVTYGVGDGIGEGVALADGAAVAFDDVVSVGVATIATSVSSGPSEESGSLTLNILRSSGSSSKPNASGFFSPGPIMCANLRKSSDEIRIPNAGAAWSSAKSASPADTKDRNWSD